MDATIDVIEWHDPLSADFTAAFPPELMTLIWSATSPGKAMRRLVVDFYAYMVPPGDMEPLWENFHRVSSKTSRCGVWISVRVKGGMSMRLCAVFARITSMMSRIGSASRPSVAGSRLCLPWLRRHNRVREA